MATDNTPVADWGREGKEERTNLDLESEASLAWRVIVVGCVQLSYSTVCLVFSPALVRSTERLALSWSARTGALSQEGGCCDVCG